MTAKARGGAKALTLSATIWKEGRVFVSKCPELGVASYGRTPTAAVEALRQAVELYLSNARKLGMMEDIEPALSSDVRFSTQLEVRA
jgi:predicted RNase H-like HicB family nuclease